MAQGVSITEIYSTLAAQFGATYINDFNKYGRVYRVYMQADAPYRATLHDLSKIYVKNNKGKMPIINLKGEEIHFGGRILAVADVFDKFTTN